MFLDYVMVATTFTAGSQTLSICGRFIHWDRDPDYIVKLEEGGRIMERETIDKLDCITSCSQP